MDSKSLGLVVCVLELFSCSRAAPAAETATLRGHVPEVIKRLNLQPVGRLPAAQRLNLAIGLPLRNQSALTNLLQQLYDPSSANFHRYLTPEQFTQQFGPTEADYQAVLHFAQTNGFVVTSTFTHRQLVDVSAAVSDIEKTFHIYLRAYQHPTEPREFFAPDIEPSVPTNVPILSISGLNNYAQTTALRRRPNNPPSGGAAGTGPFGTYQGKDFRNAYVPGVKLNGSGQYVGLVEMDGFYASDIRAYETRAGLPNVPITVISLSGSSGYPDNNTNAVAEVSLDIEMVISMAPGLAGLYVFEGNSYDEILGSMATYAGIKQFSSSFVGYGFDSSGDNLLQTMAAQGQSFFQASGDGDAYTVPITAPSDSRYVTSVGGTQLIMDATASNYVSETVWNSGFQNPGWGQNGGVPGGGYWGSGGGVSSSYSVPGWQQGVNLPAVGGSTSQRNIPDVALVAVNVWVNYFNGLSGNFEGTSIAAPLWAGFTALVNQQAAADGKPAVGFVAPACYAIGEGSQYNNCFHDITVGNNFWPGSPSQFNAAVGYDLCTGWGTPNGAAMIRALEGYAGPVFVDFNYTGSTRNGSYDAPFKTITEATNAVATKGTLFIKTSGSSSETLTISKPMTITTLGATATVGH
ncbi:MAG TPA: S53 family peptidase [Verrucomicrobiae bacterium]|nr:S53 family peptidase [Verrucomicrobiae bacterium]